MLYRTLLLLLALSACAWHVPNPAPTTPPAHFGPLRLVIRAPANVTRPYTGYATVEFHAVLLGEPSLPAHNYFCLGEMWIWGDGSVSVRETDCPVFEGTFRRNFFARHFYKRSGSYEVILILFRIYMKPNGNTYAKVVMKSLHPIRVI